MKTIKLSIFMLLLLGAAACNKNNGVHFVNTPIDANDQAADLVTSSLAVNSNGAINLVADLTFDAQVKLAVDTVCGTTWADSTSRVNTTGAATTYSYKSKYSYTLNCNDTSATNKYSVSSNLSYSGFVSSSRLSSTNSGSSVFTTSGLGKASTAYNVNGEYKSSGSFQSKVDTTYAGSSNVDIVISNLVVSKPFRVVESGSANITVSGNSPKKGAFNFTGILVFNGGNTATLTLNGTVYLVNIVTGEKIRR